MIKNIFLLFNLIILSKTFPVPEVSTLLKTCSDIFIKYELDEESKKNFNDFISQEKMVPIQFDCKQKTIQQHNFSNMYLKGFDFTNARLIDVNLKNCRLNLTLFDHTTLENVDFSNTDLKNVTFKNCKFIRCNLEKTDLSDTTLEKCKFKKVKLHGAQLCQGLEFNENIPHLELVKLYAKFVTIKDHQKTKALNKLFGALTLKLNDADKLNGADLKGLDLTDINLHKANLSKASLQNVRLSDKLILPNYQSHRDLIVLYDHFIKNQETEKAETLNMIFGSLSLDLEKTDLSNLNLKRINLFNAGLYGVNLINTNLTDANLKYTNLFTYKLNGVILSDTLTLQFNNINELFYKWIEHGPNKPLYQKLVNANVPLFEDVPNEHLKQIDWNKLNLKNANFNDADIKGCDFTHANLRRANISIANLIGAIFMGANLKAVCFINNDLSNINFKNANLTKASLDGSILNNTNLIGANLKNTNLMDTDLRGAWLSEDLQITYDKNVNELFKKWAKNDQHKPFYQKLINAKVEIIYNIPEEDLQKVNWESINLKNCRISNCKFNNINFKNLSLEKTFLMDVTFENCHFYNVYFNRDNLKHSRNINFNLCNFFDVTFKNLNLGFEKFNGCTFKNIKIETLTHEYYDQKTDTFSIDLVKSYSQLPSVNHKLLFNAFLKNFTLNLRNADLKDLNLKGIYLQKANLQEANLQRTNLEEANLKEADFTRANLKNTNLSLVKLSKNCTLPSIYNNPEMILIYQDLLFMGLIATNAEAEYNLFSPKKRKFEP